ncbi:MAG TPA: iron transporter [Rhizomicrobium sp.]|jgi:hypothetical protein
MRTVLVLISVLTASGAHAAVIGSPLVRDGLEMVLSTQTGVALDRTPSTMSRGVSPAFLQLDVHATREEAHGFAEGVFMPYLSISYVLTKDDAPTFKRAGLLYPVASGSGPHYAAGAEMAEPGTYHVTFIISPPSSRGLMRRTDKSGGVPDWWKPITANWTFQFPSPTTVSQTTK